MATPERRIIGIILAGGKARRMGECAPFAAAGGGRDKAAVELDGRSMLDHVADRFGPQVDHLLLNRVAPHSIPTACAFETIADAMPGQLGPLAGIAAGLEWLARHAGPSARLVSVTTDVPFLPTDLVARLTAHAGSQPAIAVSGGRRHPTIGIWPQTLRQPAFDALAAGQLQMDRFAREQRAIEVVFPFGESAGELIDPFFNVNTPEDLHQARAWLTGGKRG